MPRPEDEIAVRIFIVYSELFCNRYAVIKDIIKQAQSSGRTHHLSRAESRLHARGHSRSNSRLSARHHSRSRSRSHARYHSRSRSPSHSHLHGHHHSHSHSPPHTQATPVSSTLYRNRPGPSSLARSKKVQRISPSSDGEGQSEEGTQEVESKDEAAYWRHIGKVFAINHAPWLPLSLLEWGCRLETLDPSQQNRSVKGVFEELNNHNIKPEVRVTRRFQTQVNVYLSCT